MAEPYDVFLTYHPADRAEVEKLAWRLRDYGLRVYFDLWEVIPGTPFQKQLESALRNSRATVVVVGPESSSVRKPFQSPDLGILLELEASSLRSAVRVIPVFLAGRTSLPSWLAEFHGVDLGDEKGFDRLLAGIRGVAPGPGVQAPLPQKRAHKPSYLRRVELEGIRGFRRLVLDLDDPPRLQTTVIGRNGTCKTTLLRSIALALAGQEDAAALLSAPSGPWLATGEKQGVIRLRLDAAEDGSPTTSEIEFDAKGAKIRTEPEIAAKVFVCAYGVGRGAIGGEPGRDYRVVESVATLFRYDERMAASELVLRRLYDFLGDQRFDAVLASLKRALGLGPEHRIELPRGGGVEISGPDLGGRIPLVGWADGYRMTFSWMIDFYGWAMRAGAFDDDGEVCGILLVDELEQHLHPAMQREILSHLERALPHVQIVATTHSPLVALSARPEQILALHRDGERIHSVPVPPLDGYSAEDVLVEETLFGTNPYSPSTENRLVRYRELSRISPEERSPEETEELSRLAQDLNPASLPNLRDDPVLSRLEAISAMLSHEGSDG